MTGPDPTQSRDAVPPRRSLFGPRLIAALVLVSVGVAGMALGVMLDHVIIHRRVSAAFFGGRMPPEPPPELRAHFLAELTRRLDLTQPQRVRIDSILENKETTLHSLMQEMWPRFQSVATATRQQIEAVLTPEQQERFRALGPAPHFLGFFGRPPRGHGGWGRDRPPP
jgi:hypothetical protein